MSHVASRDAAPGLSRAAAADRRRDDQPRPHRDQDRAELLTAPVVYVPDASRAVGVVTKLLSIDQAAGFKAEIAADYEKVRAQHASKKGVTLVTLAAARANRAKLDYAARSSRAGRACIRCARSIWPRSADYIDWGPFFQTWDLPAATRRSSTTPWSASRRARVFADAQAMLQQIIDENWLTRQRRVRPVPGQLASATTSRSTPTSRATKC